MYFYLIHHPSPLSCLPDLSIFPYHPTLYTRFLGHQIQFVLPMCSWVYGLPHPLISEYCEKRVQKRIWYKCLIEACTLHSPHVILLKKLKVCMLICIQKIKSFLLYEYNNKSLVDNVVLFSFGKEIVVISSVSPMAFQATDS